MDDLDFGSEDKRGYWLPHRRISYGPAFAWPPQPARFLKWFFAFPGYLFPWNVLYAVFAVGIWVYLTPDLDRFASPTLGLIGFMLVDIGTDQFDVGAGVDAHEFVAGPTAGVHAAGHGRGAERVVPPRRQCGEVGAGDDQMVDGGEVTHGGAQVSLRSALTLRSVYGG